MKVVDKNSVAGVISPVYTIEFSNGFRAEFYKPYDKWIIYNSLGKEYNHLIMQAAGFCDINVTYTTPMPQVEELFYFRISDTIKNQE